MALRMRSNEKRIVAQCVTCGSELHPERAEKYDYCMAPECQEKNLKGLTMVAVGVNKSAEQYMLLDDETRDELARGKYHDRSEEHTSELQSLAYLVCRLLLEKKNSIVRR